MSKLAALAAAGLGTVSPETKRIGLHALGVGVVGAGGAATGYIVAGTWRGALTGSLVHLGLYGLGGAVLGDGRLTSTERIVYGVMGLGASVGVGYLWMKRRTA
jgi:hypothetical protein